MTEDRGDAERKKEPAAAKSVIKGEPGGIEGPRVSGGAEGGRSQVGADRSMGQNGVR